MSQEIRVKNPAGEIKVLRVANQDIRSLVSAVEDTFGLKWYSFKIIDHNHRVIYDGLTDPSCLPESLLDLSDVKIISDITFHLAPTGTLVYAIDDGPMLFHGKGDTLKKVCFGLYETYVVREISGEDNLEDIVGNIMRIPVANKITIYNWGSFPYQGHFYLNHFRNIEIKTEGSPDLFLVTSLGQCFYNVRNIKGFESLAQWNVSNVTNMSGMFHESKFTGTLEPIAKWNVSNVTNMSGMFRESKFTGTLEPLAKWDISNVRNMGYMFYLSQFTGTIDALARWNVSNVRNMSSMFSNSQFTGTIDALARWDVSNVINMYSMFSDSEFTGTLEPLAKWDVGNVTDMRYMFSDSEFTGTLEPLAKWDVSKVTDMYSMFWKSNFTGTLEPLAKWDVSNVTEMGAMFWKSKITGGIAPLSKWVRQPPEF